MSSTEIPTEKTLLQTIEALAAGAPENGFSLREIFDQLDESAFGAGLFLLALPCCIPFLYGVPQVVSLPMMALAAQMAMGRKWLGWIEHIVRPRLTVITGKRSERVIGLFLCIFCASILVPLPMTNTVPGFAVAIASFGLMQKDGLMVIGGLIIGTAWVSGLIGAVMLGAVSLFG